jgi:chemotaxis protein MotB
MAGKGGGSWKVAYADFVTAMMAFFMVMWLTAQKPEVKEAVASYFQDPFGQDSAEARGAGASLLPGHEGGLPTTFQGQKPPPGESDQDDRVNRKATQPRTSGPKINVQHHLNERALGVLIEFPDATAVLNEQAKAQLLSLLPQILGKPHKIEIRGHAPRGPQSRDGSSENPWHLCYERCLATMNFLCEQGIEANRIRLSQAGIYGAQVPRVGTEWQLDKSGVEVFLLPERVAAPSGAAHQGLPASAPPDETR